MHAKRVLVVDDDPAVVEALQASLPTAGFHVSVGRDVRQALRALREHEPDLIILDIELGVGPSMPAVNVGDGIDLLKRIRADSDVPIIMLTQSDAQAVKLLAFHLGADDYVIKPFHASELVARVAAILRRGGQSLQPIETHLNGRLRIDTAARRVVKDDVELQLTPTEFDLLQCLGEAAGRALTRRTLLSMIRSFDYYGGERSIDVHIRHLRSKIEDDPSRPQLISTVRGVGYRFETGP